MPNWRFLRLEYTITSLASDLVERGNSYNWIVSLHFSFFMKENMWMLVSLHINCSVANSKNFTKIPQVLYWFRIFRCFFYSIYTLLALHLQFSPYSFPLSSSKSCSLKKLMRILIRCVPTTKLSVFSCSFAPSLPAILQCLGAMFSALQMPVFGYCLSW